MKRVRLSPGGLLRDVDTGVVIYPYSLDSKRDVTKLPDGRKHIGDVHHELKSDYYTGPVILEMGR